MRIIVVEDQNLVLDSLVNLINGEPDFEVVKALQNYADVYREREEEDYGD